MWGLRSFGVAVAAAALLAGGTPTAALAAPAPSGHLSAASEFVGWYPFTGTDSNWHCGATMERREWYEQMCVVVNGRAYQAAYIIKTKVAGWNYTIGVENVRNATFSDRTYCEGFIGAAVRKVCYRPTETASRGDYVQGYGYSVWSDQLFSPTVRIS